MWYFIGPNVTHIQLRNFTGTRIVTAGAMLIDWTANIPTQADYMYII